MKQWNLQKEDILSSTTLPQLKAALADLPIDQLPARLLPLVIARLSPCSRNAGSADGPLTEDATVQQLLSAFRACFKEIIPKYLATCVGSLIKAGLKDRQLLSDVIECMMPGMEVGRVAGCCWSCSGIWGREGVGAAVQLRL